MTEAVKQAQVMMQKKHLRWTKQRKLIIEKLAQNPDRYINIVEVDHLLHQTYPGMSHDTIYRNVKEFESLGIVEVRQQRDQMQVKLCCDQEHHHHFICDVCGRVQEISLPPIDWDFLKQQLPGAKITDHRFELHGVCATCRAQKRPM